MLLKILDVPLDSRADLNFIFVRVTGVAKYNALIRIEDEIKMSGGKTLYAGAEGFSVGPKVRNICTIHLDLPN